ncbi:MAG: DUF1415 domain-containing protein [Chitinophagaceae bacterium]|nr:DUF1415 domain-containing protein [Chitinophagaceae bacterium]
MFTADEIIVQTKKWINEVVIGCNFCPFAAKAVKQHTIYYKVEDSNDTDICMQAFVNETNRLDDDATIETVFLIFSSSYAAFDDYLDLVDLAEEYLLQNGYEGIYQVASFHPLYVFAGADENDAANYTNRSVYPMLHLLREASIDKALENYKDPENIPDRNIAFAKKKGLLYMKMLRDTCISD